MKEQVTEFLNGQLSRREFVRALTAMGLSTVAIQSVVESTTAVQAGKAGAAGRKATGTGGSLMVEQMKSAGVRYLFTNPGSFEVGLFDAFLGRPDMQLIVGLHEGIVIAMADGYHKVTGKPGFVNVHVIAGTAQAAGQMYNASRDRSALVVTAGMIDNETFSDNLLLGARPGYSQKDINRQFTKISWESSNAAGLPVMLRRAFKVAMTSPQGPVYMAIPHRVLEKPRVSANIYDWEQFILPNDIPPNAEQVKQVARRLLSAKRPLMVLGDGITKAGAQQEALDLAELLAIPVAHCRRSVYHNFSRQNKLYAGEFWIERKKSSATTMIMGRDFVLNCGANDVGGREILERSVYDKEAVVACIGLDPNEIGRTQRFNIGMMANPKLALRSIIDAVKGIAAAARIKKIKASRQAFKSWRARLAKPKSSKAGKGAIHPDVLGQMLDRKLDKNAIVVSENITGSNHCLSTGPGQDEKMWLSNTSSGLGWGVGAATGAQLGAPNRQVVCNIGDGSVMYSAAGFWSQARYGVPVLTVVCNNRCYQTVRQAYVEYDGRMKEANRFTGLYLGDPDISYVKLAQSQGIEGVRVEESSKLEKALDRGIAATGRGEPFLIDVNVQRVGIGADSTWHQQFNLAKTRNKKS